MKRLASYRWELLIGLSYLTGIILYLLLVRPVIPDLYTGNAPKWLENLITNFYPRFLVEKERFDLSFFIGKADQVIIRAGLVMCLGLILSFSIKSSKRIYDKISAFWNVKTSLTTIQVLRKSYSLVMLLYISDWYFDLIALSKLQVFYSPILLFKLLHIPLVNELWMNGFVSLFVVCLIMIFIGKWTWQASIISGLCFLLFQGYYQCFGKILHTFTPFIHAAIIFPFLLFEEKKAILFKRKTAQNWPLRLIQLAIASCYLFSGLEKLLISQLDWLKPDTLVAYIQLHEAPVGLWLLQFDWVMYLFTFGALIFQLGFISIVFYPKLRWLFLPMGLCFHWGTFILLGVGWWIHPWQVAYLFFLPKTTTQI